MTILAIIIGVAIMPITIGYAYSDKNYLPPVHLR
jgi:hypothetical protein